MKKTLAVLLSVLMVISTITCMFTVTTAQAATPAGELIQNGDFENLTLNPVGTNYGGIAGNGNPSVLLNGKWYRATGGLSYATYGDLSDYNAETDEVTKAAATEYAKYFTACTTTIAQPDDATNHIGRSNQTILQAINIGEGTYTFKFKVRTNENTPYVAIFLRGLQNSATDGSIKITDSFYDKYSIDVIKASGNFTYDDTALKGVKIYPANVNEWTDVEFIANITEIENPVSSNTAQTIIETDFAMLQIYHDSAALSNGENGKNYRKNGAYYDDISVKAFTYPFGEGEFYKNGEKQENCNEYGGAKYTVNGKEALGIGVGDTVVATPDYNADGNVFVGWYKNDELFSRDETITFTVNSADIYAPKFISKNLLTDSASYESYDVNTSLKHTGTDYPSGAYFGGNKNAGYLGATFEETIYNNKGNAINQTAGGTISSSAIGASVTNLYAHTGNNSVKLTNSYWTASMGIDVKPNTDYVLSYYILAPKREAAVSNTIHLSAISTTVNTGAAGTGSTAPLNQAASLYLDSKDITAIHDGENWIKVTHSFNSMNLSKVYFVIGQTSDTAAAACWAYIDDMTLVVPNYDSATVPIKFVDTDGVDIPDADSANIYAKVNVNEDFDGSNLLSVDYNKEDGAYSLLGWYDADNNLLSKDEIYDYEGDLTNISAKIINRNLYKAASFEDYENNANVAVADITKYPNEGEWGASKTAGYYGATYEEVIYDKYGYSYQQTATGTAGAHGAASITNTKAYKGSNSTLLTGSYATMVTGLDVEPGTNYTVTYYVLADTATTMKYTGITTTVNVAYLLHPEALDGGTQSNGMGVAVGNMGDAYALSKLSQLTVSDTEWLKVTHTFNSGNFTKVYLCVCPTAGEKYYIDELSLVAEEKAETIDVKLVDANGDAVSDDVAANAIAQATVEKDIYTGTKTAKVNYEIGAYTFLGWYNADDTLISANKEMVVSGSLDGVYAKVQNNNLLDYAASYEGYELNTQLKYTGTDYPSGVYFGGSKNAGYLGQTFAETIYDNKGNAIEQIAGGEYAANNISAKVSSTYAHTGDKSIYLQNGYWTASMGIDVKPNTDYVLSYYILAPKSEAAVSNTIQLSAISTTVNTGISGSDGKQDETGEYALNQSNTLFLDSADITTLHDGENWIKVTHSFNSMSLSKVYLVIGQTSDTAAAACWAYIDDMAMIETIPTTMDVEMKNCASLDLIEANMYGLYIGQQLSFKVIDNIETAAVVTFNGEAVTPDANGVYTIILANENALSVRFEGDENLPNYDEDEFGRKLSENNHEVYSEPVWSGDTVYHETALFTPDKDTVKLLYPVDEIVSLRSYDLKTNFIEGYDFEITADGQIKRLEGGRIPVWATSLITDADTGWKTTDGRYVVLTGDTTYPKYAISVTYKHSTTFDGGFTPAAPESQYANLNNVMAKLEKGEEVNIVVYGDSISCGWSSSGLTPDIKIYDESNTEGNYITRYNINVAPYAPTWVQMLETELASRYPDAKINVKNLSLGGKSSPWGAENIAARLALWKDEAGNQVTPDLIMVGFGVNDSAGGVTVDNFKTNMKAIVDNARTATGNANMEALYYSPMFPNQAAINWPAEKLLAYETVLEELAAADENVGLYKLSSIFSEIIKNKSCEDYLNTNLNHGNDFTARLYYTGIMAAMTADENAKTTPDTPAAPVAESVTENTVTLKANDGYEYSMDGVIWQTSNVFEGLIAETEYTFYQRVAETDANYASYASAPLTVTTPAAFVGIIGDANGDEVVNLKDLVALAQYAAGWETVTINKAVMDLNKDGAVDLEDVNYLARNLAGWDDCPIE